MKLHVSQELQCKIPDMKTSSLKKQKIGTFKQLTTMKIPKETVCLFLHEYILYSLQDDNIKSYILRILAFATKLNYFTPIRISFVYQILN